MISELHERAPARSGSAAVTLLLNWALCPAGRLTPAAKIKQWLQQSGLPVDKMVQLAQISPVNTVEAMEKHCKRVAIAWFSVGCLS